MAFIMPNAGEGKKAYLKRAFGIGNGGGKGRISADGHVKLAEAIAKGATFPEPVVASKAPKVKVSTAAPKPVIPTDRKDEARAVDPAAIREWAKEKGIEISARGRISAETTLAYLADVPEAARSARGATTGEKDLRAAAPRTAPEGTKWRVDFTYKGEPVTMMVSDKSACRTCGVSLGWHTCRTPSVATGYGDVDGIQRMTIIEPKE
jgi:Lsr2